MSIEKAKTLTRQLAKADKGLIITVTLLILSGLVFSFSASFTAATSPFMLFKKQAVFAFLGVSALIVFAKYYQWFKHYAPPKAVIIFIAVLLVWALLSPSTVNVKRWINLGFTKIQPSEFAKIAVIYFTACFIDKNSKNIARDLKTFLKLCAWVGSVILLIVAGKDLGIPAIISATFVAMLFAGNAKPKYIIILICVGILGGTFAIASTPYRLKRTLTFLRYEEFANKETYQLNKSIEAIGSGGWKGVGLGNSRIKLDYLPESHNDFVFAVIAEEGGLLFSGGVICLFGILIFKGITIAKKTKYFVDKLTALGITVCVGIQAIINMAMSMALLPTKGVALPFYSSGGSSLISTLIMMGILINLSAKEGAAKL